MEEKPNYYNKKHYIDCKRGTFIIKKSLIPGIKNIRFTGKLIIENNTVIRGDLAKFHIGKYVIIKERCNLHPTTKSTRNT